MNTKDLQQLNINVLTQEQYAQAKADEALDQDSLYMVDDDIHQMGVELDFEGVEKRTLLWTNPNPTSAFAAQSIQLDLSKYDYIEVAARGYTLNDYLYNIRERIKVGEAGNLVYVTGGTGVVGGVLYAFRRNVYASPTQVSFDSVFSATPSAQWSVYTAGTGCVPLEIYGIKKLQPSYNVIPQQVDYVVDNRDGKRTWKSGVIEDYGNPLFTTESFSEPATVAANGALQVNFDISKSGYTPLGIVGASVGGTGSSAARIYQWVLESSTAARLLITNDSATQRTWTAVVIVLYQKNG